MVEEFDRANLKQNKFKTMSIQLKRLKTQHINPFDENIIHFIHKSNITKCIVFSLFYHVVMSNDHENDALFPRWKNLVKQDDNGTNSQVSNQFKKAWNILYKKGIEYCKDFSGLDQDEIDTINSYCFLTMSKNLGIHSGKKKGVQDLGDSELVPQDIIGRCGWIVKTFHTFFDYWNCTGKSMSKSGRTLNDWPSSEGGVPPSFKHVTTSREKIEPFVNRLLGHTKIPTNMSHFLVANGIRFFSDFCTILKNEPSKQYNSYNKMISKHTFIFKVSTNSYFVLINYYFNYICF